MVIPFGHIIDSGDNASGMKIRQVGFTVYKIIQLQLQLGIADVVGPIQLRGRCDDTVNQILLLDTAAVFC